MLGLRFSNTQVTPRVTPTKSVLLLNLAPRMMPCIGLTITPSSLPLSHGACTRTRKPRAFATPCLPEPRQRATPAPWLRASDHRRTSCPATAAPLRRPAVRLLAGLRLAGGYRVGCPTTPEAAPLALLLLLPPSRQRRLLSLADVCAFCPPSAPPALLAASSATPG